MSIMPRWIQCDKRIMILRKNWTTNRPKLLHWRHYKKISINYNTKRWDSHNIWWMKRWRLKCCVTQYQLCLDRYGHIEYYLLCEYETSNLYQIIYANLIFFSSVNEIGLFGALCCGWTSLNGNIKNQINK